MERAAATLALAEELNRRVPRDVQALVACAWRRDGFEVVAPVPAGWRPRGVAARFADAFGRPLIVVPSQVPTSPVPLV